MSWFSHFQCRTGKSSQKRPFKIKCLGQQTYIGVVTRNLQDLFQLAVIKFSYHHPIKLVLAEDGTEVDDDDYFQTLPNQTELICLQRYEVYVPERKITLQQILDGLHDINKQEISEAINSETNPELVDILAKILSQKESDVLAETRKEDPDWFNGKANSFQTKNAVMSENARRRVRSYLNTVQDYTKRVRNPTTQSKLISIINLFMKELENCDYFSDYFSRDSQNDDLRMCDANGWFACEGLYNEDTCYLPEHRINPYGSYHARILFQTWNLDHGIEKSREVLPCLQKALDAAHNRKVHWHYFFDLMFTRKNLRCVHITCHDKKEHTDARCDPSCFYI